VGHFAPLVGGVCELFLFCAGTPTLATLSVATAKSGILTEAAISGSEYYG